MRSVFTALLITASVSLIPSYGFAQSTSSAKPAATTEVSKQKRELTPGQQAMRDRQKACGAEWKSVKGTKEAEGKNWPKFWSECNKRLKEKK